MKTGKVTKKNLLEYVRICRVGGEKREGNKCKSVRESGHSLVDHYSLV